MSLFRPRGLYGSPEISLNPLLVLLAALRPDQVELARSLCFGRIQLVVRGSDIATPTPAPLDFDSLSDAYSRVGHTLFQYSLSGQKASVVWDKFGTSPRQAINRALMNHLGRVGSDTGIRTRVSAVRGRRPRPLDDIANRELFIAPGRMPGTIDNFLFSHARAGVASGCVQSGVHWSQRFREAPR